MKKTFLLLVCMLATISVAVCQNKVNTGQAKEGVANENFFDGKRILIVYFSWGGTTQRMAEEIQRVTHGDMFRIEPETAYPTEYKPCTEVAKKERDNNERPAIKGKVENWDKYDIIFLGCPVWWHIAPMIISTFAEQYDFKGKTVIPFCTYAATYRDETLQKITALTKDANHLQGLGTTGSTSEVKAWIRNISNENTK